MPPNLRYFRPRGASKLSLSRSTMAARSAQSLISRRVHPFFVALRQIDASLVFEPD
jgi:hypothetical protein